MGEPKSAEWIIIGLVGLQILLLMLSALIFIYYAITFKYQEPLSERRPRSSGQIMELKMMKEATDNDYYEGERPMANDKDHEYEDVSNTETDNDY